MCYFSEEERRQLELLGADAGERALELWALKESVVKALGETVWDGLRKVSLGVTPPNITWNTLPPRGKEDDWALMLGRLRATHVVALALNAAGARGLSQTCRIHTLGENLDAADDVKFESFSGQSKSELAPL